jgi:hypothetical protein
LITAPAWGAPARPPRSRGMKMIEVDNPPLVLFCIVLLAFLAPQIYSFFVDKFQKGKPPVRQY